MQNPFKKSEEIKERLKLFLYGDTGTGKTFLSLQFPSPAVIDLEKGTVIYAKTFKFEVNQAETLQDVYNSLNFLATEKHNCKTLIIDPLTVLWELLTRKWTAIYLDKENKKTGQKENYYRLSPNDYGPIKSEFKDLMKKIVDLDMNIICICRQKDKVSGKGKDYMEVIGETFDCEKSVDSYFDTSIQLKKAGDKRLALVKKDRNNILGVNTFECNYSVFEKSYPGLNFESVPVVRMVTKEQVDCIKTLMEILHFSASNMQEICANVLGKTSKLSDLTEIETDKIIETLRDIREKANVKFNLNLKEENQEVAA